MNVTETKALQKVKEILTDAGIEATTMRNSNLKIGTVNIEFQEWEGDRGLMEKLVSVLPTSITTEKRTRKWKDSISIFLPSCSLSSLHRGRNGYKHPHGLNSGASTNNQCYTLLNTEQE